MQKSYGRYGKENPINNLLKIRLKLSNDYMNRTVIPSSLESICPLD